METTTRTQRRYDHRRSDDIHRFANNIIGEYAMAFIQCDQCSHNQRVKDEYIGKTVKCPKCASSVEVTAKDNESDLFGDDDLEETSDVKSMTEGPTTASHKVKEEWSNAVDNSPIVKATKKIFAGDGVVIASFKLVNGSKEYSYHDPDYPALSACLTFVSTIARLHFILGGICLLGTGLVGSMFGDGDIIRMFASLVDAPILEFVSGDESPVLELSIFRVLWEMIFHALRFVLIMGGCEIARLLTRIEKNTR